MEYRGDKIERGRISAPLNDTALSSSALPSLLFSALPAALPLSYFLKPSFSQMLLYRAGFSRFRYFKRADLRPTICKRPLREAKSFLCLLRCSVRCSIRAVNNATCTSGEPVSVSCVRNLPIMSCLFSISPSTIMPNANLLLYSEKLLIPRLGIKCNIKKHCCFFESFRRVRRS